MSVLIEFSIFPLDQGASVSDAVSLVVDMIAKSGHPYRLTAMGTIIETQRLDTALGLVEQAYKILEAYGAQRVYAAIKLDIRAGREHGLTDKIQSIESRIGKVSS